MRQKLSELSTQFIVDKAGKKTGVILDMKTFQNLLEEIEDLYLATLAQAALQEKGECVSQEEVEKYFKKSKKSKK
ncbi:hypothetical protein K2W90_03570 [Candidatus Babeliales bacterium]|nr:hypothetical protein [Candidatus Babeliales bacterium]